MGVSRRKAPKLDAPESVEEATELLGSYIALLTEVEKIRADADASIAQIQAARDAFAAPVDAEAKDIFRRLRNWWAIAGEQLTEGKRKSIELAGCTIGLRTTPPALKLIDITAEELIGKLAELGQDWALRVKTELDKQSIITALKAGDDTSTMLQCIGAMIRQKDEFFIDRAAKKEPDPIVHDMAEDAL